VRGNFDLVLVVGTSAAKRSVSTLSDGGRRNPKELHEHHRRTNNTTLTNSQWVTQPVSARVRAMRECSGRRIVCDTATDSMQLLKGLQEEGNDPALHLPQAVQGR
jgi:hypothetical protein